MKRLSLAIAFVFLFVGSLQAQQWNWSPVAEYQKAACEVRDGNAAGSGVYVDLGDGFRGVLTCEHIHNTGTATATFPTTGERLSGSYTTDMYGFDVGFIVLQGQPKGIKPLTISETPPNVGDRVEFVTYGGPGNGKARHFFGHLTTSNDRTMYFDNYVISGDSGGTILNTSGQVVGVQSVGLDEVNYPGWNVYKGSGSPPFAAIRQFCQRVKQKFSSQQCGPGGCSPYAPPGGGQYGGGGGGLYPDPQPPIAPQPPTQPKPDPVRVEVDYDQLADAVIERMKQNPEPFKGPPGKDGKDGADGNPATIDYDQVAENVQQRLKPIEVVFLGRDNAPVASQTVPLGGVLELPPVRMEIQHPAGEVYYQEKPLGGTIALELIPKR